MIPQETIQLIQNRIDIIDIISNFIKLKKRGSNYLGVCPFHNEKSPSFTVSPSKEIYKCFGCGKSGNAISFIMEHEKYSYVDTLKWLASRYNIEIQEEYSNPEQRIQQQAAESLFIINKFAKDYFSNNLFENEEGKMAGLGYLKERGFNEETIQKFQLGYCLEYGDAFAKSAIDAKYNKEYLIKSGLVASREDRLVDNYRGRVIFPIHNQSGKVIGFGARLIRKNDKAPKYINTPENEIYSKSKLLYGMYFARQAIDKQNECLLVEGYTDVVSLHQAGIENVVASGGTSLTIDQLRLIKKYTSNLTIIYDGDAAGIKAAARGLDLALEEGLIVKLVLIPDNEDPDSYVKKIGTNDFKEFIAKERKDFILFQLETALKDAQNDSQKKSEVVNRIAESIAKINKAEDFTRQQDYIHRCSELLKIDEEGLTVLVNKFIRGKISIQEKKQEQTKEGENLPETQHNETLEDFNDLLFKDELQERALVRSLLEFGINEWENGETIADYIFKEFEINGLAEMFDNKHLLQLIEAYRTLYQLGLNPDNKSFLYHEEAILNTLAVSIMDNSSSDLSPNWLKNFDTIVATREMMFKEDVSSALNYLKLRKIKRLISENQLELQNMKPDGDYITLVAIHRHLKQLEMELVKRIGTVIIK
jgi:DNA primase